MKMNVDSSLLFPSPFPEPIAVVLANADMTNRMAWRIQQVKIRIPKPTIGSKPSNPNNLSSTPFTLRKSHLNNFCQTC